MLDVDPKAIQQVNCTGNIDRAATIFFTTIFHKEL